MDEPETLLLPNENGNMYRVNTSYEDLKSNIYLQYGIQEWNNVLRMWYKELLFNYKFEEAMEELRKIGAAEKGNTTGYSTDDIHNSLVYIRSKVVKELGNGALSNLNEEVSRMWKEMEKQAENAVNN